MIDLSLIEAIQKADELHNRLNKMIMLDIIKSENRQLFTSFARIKRNKRFKRNANRIFKRKAKYIGYISGTMTFTEEMLKPFRVPYQ